MAPIILLVPTQTGKTFYGWKIQLLGRLVEHEQQNTNMLKIVLICIYYLLRKSELLHS